jgi:hypothetical protein
MPDREHRHLVAGERPTLSEWGLSEMNVSQVLAFAGSACVQVIAIA